MANDDKWTAEDEERLQRAMRSTVRKVAERERDLKLATCLLTGGRGNQRGAKRYYNAAEERPARKALARLLRNKKPLDTGLRQQLAALFDLDDERPAYSSSAGAVERKFVFVSRKGEMKEYRKSDGK